MVTTLKGMKYSEVKLIFFDLLQKKRDEDPALITHYLQNSEYYGNYFVESPIAKYFSNTIPYKLELERIW